MKFFVASVLTVSCMGMASAAQSERFAVDPICLAKQMRNGVLTFDAGHAPISQAAPRQSAWDQSLSLPEDHALEASTRLPELSRATEGVCAG